MAAAIKALNAKIRAHPVLDYFCSTHFWGPASNFGIPIAAVMDTQKDPELYVKTIDARDWLWTSLISGRMTAALTLYSAVFMRYALAVTPKNYLLFGCHVVNCSAQTIQGYRFLNYWKFGGRENEMDQKAKQVAGNVINESKSMASDVAKSR